MIKSILKKPSLVSEKNLKKVRELKRGEKTATTLL